MEGCLTVQEVLNKYITGCVAKMQMTMGRLFGKAILAGMMIALGACASSVAAHTIPDVGLARLAAAGVFPVGLMMVVLLGGELFTGDCLAAMSIFDGTHKIKTIVKFLVVVILGNLFGATMLAIMVSLSGQLDYSAGMLGAYTIKVAAGKVGLTFTEGIVSGILCNILVCAAVLMAMCAKDVTGKLMACFFVIMLFVTAGFEHCVANMYYITAGMLAMDNPEYVELAMETYGFTAEQLGQLNLYHYFVTNLLPVTIGNTLGGIVFLGGPLFYLHAANKPLYETIVQNIKTNIEKEDGNNDFIYSDFPDGFSC